ncbi:MAG: S-layer homology domain-containing protein, partial [Clostridia bacterium]
KSGMTDSMVMSESYTIKPQVATPTASPAGGAVAAGTTVALSTSTTGATIYYTTDGTTPTASSNVYSGPITVNSAMTIKAIAVKAGMTDSTVMSERYTIRVPIIVVTAVKSPAPLTDIPNGTAKTVSALGLPLKVEAVLSNGNTVDVEVDWAVATANYDPASKEQQTFTVTGSLMNLPNGVTNPQNLTASIQVTVNAAETKDKEIVSVTTPEPITGLANGTPKKADALGLPEEVKVALNDGSNLLVNVKWDVAHADYNPKNREAQTFTVTGELIKLPHGVTNPNNLNASIQVSVDAAAEGDIVKVHNPDAITGLPNGTPKKADALGLPENVKVTLDNGSTLLVNVKWDVAHANYDPKSKKAQRFTVSGELVKLPKGVTNSKKLMASIQVQVKAADDNEEVRNIVKVSQPEAIKDVENGTRKTASALGLPEQVKVTLDDDSKISVDVEWDVTDADYDPDSTQKQRFTVKGKLSDLPDSVENPKNLGVSISVTVNAAPRDDHRDDDKTSSGKNEGRDPNISIRQVRVEAGNNDSLTIQLEVTRKISENGKQLDEIVFERKKAKEILQKAEDNNKDVIRITIDDPPSNPAEEISIKVPENTLGLIKEKQVALEIKSGDVTITIPREVIAALSGKDLYFHIVPIKKQSEKQTVTQRILNAEEVKQAAGGQEVEVVGKPMLIETNYSNQPTKVMFPLQDVNMPTPEALRAFLASLAVYVEHTDGEKELKTGEIKYDEHGNPAGIEIEINKFSTFTILSLKGKQEHVEHAAYMTGYPDRTFQPNRVMTRAEIAAVLSHMLQEAGQQQAADGTAVFQDVQANHWAAQAIQQVYSAGLMNGDGNGLFHPNAKVTRAEMATIFVKFKKLSTSGNNLQFADTQGHWAAASIAAAVEQGMMKGYADGSFRPNQGLTRAEAATLFNRLSGRGPLTGLTNTIWSDVPLTHWAFAEIAEATQSHAALKLVDGTEKTMNQQ